MMSLQHIQKPEKLRELRVQTQQCAPYVLLRRYIYRSTNLTVNGPQEITQVITKGYMRDLLDPEVSRSNNFYLKDDLRTYYITSGWPSDTEWLS